MNLVGHAVKKTTSRSVFLGVIYDVNLDMGLIDCS